MDAGRSICTLAAALVVAACVSLPTGPSQMALPGTGRNFDDFRRDDATCRQFAYNQVGGVTAQGATTQSGVSSAAIGTVVGAAAGAAIDGSHGAGIGAGTGLLFGSLAGAGTAQTSAYYAQRSYDHAYLQCMYAQGHRIPVQGRFVSERDSHLPPPPPPNAPPPR
jgi:hypothetical protein